MELASLVIVLGLMVPGLATAAEDHGIMNVCKAECPQAKTEEEAHKCMEGVMKKKKSDRKFRKSDCFAAVTDHEKHEKGEGHQH